jgi:hypothetical protein
MLAISHSPIVVELIVVEPIVVEPKNLAAPKILRNQLG